jgi:hypothetical protein
MIRISALLVHLYPTTAAAVSLYLTLLSGFLVQQKHYQKHAKKESGVQANCECIHYPNSSFKQSHE